MAIIKLISPLWICLLVDFLAVGIFEKICKTHPKLYHLVKQKCPLILSNRKRLLISFVQAKQIY